MIDKPGIYQMSSDDYHSDPCKFPSLSRGTINDLINFTPAHARYYHPQLNPDYVQEEKTAFDLGTAAHSLILEGVDCCEIIDAPDWRSKDAKTARDEARLAGKTPLLKHQHKDVLAMVDAFRAQLAASELGIKDLQKEGSSELSYIWNEGDVWFRIRLDWISHKNFGDRRLILDLKTCGQSAAPEAFKASDHARDIQAAFYRRGVKAVEGGKSPRFIFANVETSAPFLCSYVGLDPQTMAIAGQKVDAGIFLWRKCLATGEWPGYPQRVCYVESRPYEVAAWESRYLNLGNGED